MLIFRVITFILALSLLSLFVGLNVQTKIDLIFLPGWRLQQVPILLLLFCSYLLGIISLIPFIIQNHWRKKKKIKQRGSGDISEKNLSDDDEATNDNDDLQ